MIVHDRPGLSLSRQCRLLSISRSLYYCASKGESPENLALMRRIDELFLKFRSTAAVRLRAGCGARAFASAVTGFAV